MSQPNEQSNEQPKGNRFGINEQGEVTISDPELEASLQELNEEELDAIAGGATNNCPCTNNCKQT